MFTGLKILVLSWILLFTADFLNKTIFDEWYDISFLDTFFDCVQKGFKKLRPGWVFLNVMSGVTLLVILVVTS